jgi:hypothetical protein
MVLLRSYPTGTDAADRVRETRVYTGKIRRP